MVLIGRNLDEAEYREAFERALVPELQANVPDEPARVSREDGYTNTGIEP